MDDERDGEGRGELGADDAEPLSDELIAFLNRPIMAEPTPYEKCIISDFEGILRFYDVHQRAPSHDADNIFERRYAVRLDLLKQDPQALEVLAPLDHPGLVTGWKLPSDGLFSLDVDALLAELNRGSDDAK